MTLTKQRKHDGKTSGGSITALVPPILCSSPASIAVMIPITGSTVASIVGPTTPTPMVMMVLPVVTWPKATSLPAGEIIEISCEYLVWPKKQWYYTQPRTKSSNFKPPSTVPPWVLTTLKGKGFQPAWNILLCIIQQLNKVLGNIAVLVIEEWCGKT